MAKKIIAFVTDFDRSELSKAENIEFAATFEEFKALLVGDVVPVISTDLYADDDALTENLMNLVQSSNLYFYTLMKELEVKGQAQMITDCEIDFRSIDNVNTSVYYIEDFLSDKT